MGIIEKLRIDGKKVLVTGGAKGIGKSIAKALAEAGADVAIVDQDFSEATKTALEIEALGVKSIPIKTDVTKADELQELIKTMIKEFGQIDVAFCNVDSYISIKAEEMTTEQWEEILKINLTGVFLIATTIGKVMLKQCHGSIINIASMAGHVVNNQNHQCGYNVSKAGVIMLTKSLAKEWLPYNVRVNSISLGHIQNQTLEWENTQLSNRHLKMESQQNRIGKPEELQAIAIYLANDVSNFVTGSDFLIDASFSF